VACFGDESPEVSEVSENFRGVRFSSSNKTWGLSTNTAFFFLSRGDFGDLGDGGRPEDLDVLTPGLTISGVLTLRCTRLSGKPAMAQRPKSGMKKFC